MSDDNVTNSGSLTISSDSNTLTTSDVYTIDPKYWEYYDPRRMGIITNITEPKINKSKGGDENMRYLYEVILVNPKNDDFYIEKIVARSETAALMLIYNESHFSGKIEFDELKTSCRVLMEWKKKESLKKAIETIKKAVE